MAAVVEDRPITRSPLEAPPEPPCRAAGVAPRSPGPVLGRRRANRTLPSKRRARMESGLSPYKSSFELGRKILEQSVQQMP
eukprot:4205598-Pyramimonas_sp.AAC.1